jgi:hypothetical protein
MTKGLDVAKMEAAFKRAAHKAVHGTREERAGKFIPGNERPSASQSKRRHPQSSKSGRRSSQA